MEPLPAADLNGIRTVRASGGCGSGDPDDGIAQLGDHGVQVADPEAQPPALFGPAEVVGVGQERREDGLAPPAAIRPLAVGRRNRVGPEVPNALVVIRMVIPAIRLLGGDPTTSKAHQS